MLDTVLSASPQYPFQCPQRRSREATITPVSQTELSRVQCLAKFTQPVRDRAGPQPELPHPCVLQDNRAVPYLLLFSSNVKERSYMWPLAVVPGPCAFTSMALNRMSGSSVR